MTVTFHNVTITLEAESPRQAYDENGAAGNVECRDTSELFPLPGDPRESNTGLA